MGAATTPSYFQQTMQYVLAPVLRRGALVYLDDILVYGKTEAEFYDRLRQTIALLHAHNFKISATKSIFIAREVIWCGRLWSAEGYQHIPSRIEALTSIPLPNNGAELYQFLGAAGWMRAAIPDFVRLTAPLQDVMERVKSSAPPRPGQANNPKKDACKRIPLTEELGWNEEVKEAFRALQEAIKNCVLLGHPREDHQLLVITDASKEAWGGIITMVPAHQWEQVTGESIPEEAGAKLPLIFSPREIEEGNEGPMERAGKPGRTETILTGTTSLAIWAWC
eukprot:GHVU01143887.1.p1 GENE.GHVU01143887.1~~GHVU01143887.1.p1  ORF type:complete len:295 (-),score=28.77 GHVU01143887.1:318-1157(-)